MKDFFQDAPWLNVPQHRQGSIVIERRGARRGLLGGSSTNSKTSKLAALAARRRQKDASKPSDAANASPSTANHAPFITTDCSSVGALHLQQTGSKNVGSPTEASCAQESSGPTPDQSFETNERVATSEPSIESVDNINLKASPSSFATVMFEGPGSNHDRNLRFDEPRTNGSFDFSVPSPDDVVSKAQTGKGSHN